MRALEMAVMARRCAMARAVRWREGAAHRVCLLIACQAKVGDHEPRAADQDVGTLEVAMQNGRLERVQVHHAGCNLLKRIQKISLGRARSIGTPLALMHLAQAPARHILAEQPEARACRRHP